MRLTHLFRHFKDREEREREWRRAGQLDERVRLVETDMKAITAYVEDMPDLGERKRRQGDSR